MIRGIAAFGLVLSLSACSAYSRYADAIHRDVDAPTQAIALSIARLQLTVVHGSVPHDSVQVWAHDLENAAKLSAKGSADFAGLTPPDQSLSADHYRLSEAIAHQSAMVATAAAEAETCLKTPAGCDRLASLQYFKVLEPMTEQQDVVRWSRARIARDLQPHGILLSGMIQ